MERCASSSRRHDRYICAAQQAYQLGGAIVLPVVALVVGQLAGAVVLDARLAAVLGLIVWLVAAAILYVASRGFRRERLLRQV